MGNDSFQATYERTRVPIPVFRIIEPGALARPLRAQFRLVCFERLSSKLRFVTLFQFSQELLEFLDSKFLEDLLGGHVQPHHLLP